MRTIRRNRTRQWLAILTALCLVMTMSFASNKVMAIAADTLTVVFDNITYSAETDNQLDTQFGTVQYKIGTDGTATDIDTGTGGITVTKGSNDNGQGGTNVMNTYSAPAPATAFYLVVSAAEGYEASIDLDNAGNLTSVGTVTHADGTVAVQLSYRTDGARYRINFQQAGGGDPGPDPGPAIAVDDGYLVITDIEGNPISYNGENKTDFGHIQYSLSATGDTDWLELPTTTTKTFGTDPDTYIGYAIPSGAKRLRVYSTANYTCSLRDNDNGQDNGNGFHGLLVNSEQTVDVDDGNGGTTPETLAAGTVIAEEGYNIDPDDIGDSSKPFTSVSANVFAVGDLTAKGYIVSFNPHNILWYNDAAYAAANGGDDAIVTGGRVEFVSCKMNSEDTDDTGLVGNNNGPLLDSNNETVGYGYAAKEGAVLTLKFIPDYGCQFKEASINGNPVSPQTDDYTFEFKFPQGTYHMSVTFSKGEDKAVVSGNAVRSAAVEGSDQLDVNGNLLLTVDDATTPAEETSALFSDELETGYEVADYVTLDLETYAEKGGDADTTAGVTAENSWTQTQTELNTNVEVSLTLDPELRDSNGVYSVVRAHETDEGTVYTELPATYDAAAGELTFETNQFSTYAIAKKHIEPTPASYPSIVCSHPQTEDKVTKKATFTENGTITKTCKICGTVISTSEIPKVSDVSQSFTKFTYNGNRKAPVMTIKDSKGAVLAKDVDYSLAYPNSSVLVGQYSVKITLTGDKYDGTLTKKYTIRPKGTSITRISGTTVSWKQQPIQTSGYQLKYSKTKTFGDDTVRVYVKGSTSAAKTINGLDKGSTYYVKIRTYKVVNVSGDEVMIFSTWSKWRSITAR